MIINTTFLISTVPILLFLFFFKDEYFFKLGNLLNLIDYPNNNRKIHSKPMPSIGGVILFFFLIIFFLLNFIIYGKINYNLFFFISIFFFLGILDDLININAYLKLFLLTFFIIIFIYFKKDFNVSQIYFETFNYHLNLKLHLGTKFSIFFTLLCCLLLVNAINMTDGINGNCLSQSIFYIFLFNIMGLNENFYILTIFIMIIILIKNLKNFLFLGNAGSHLISGLLIFQLIENNNINYNISAEIIFLTLILPGIDMLRLFISRIYLKKNPFSADKKHFHHYLYFGFCNKNILHFHLANMLFAFIPILLFLFFKINFFVIIIFWLFFYFSIFKISKSKFF